MARNRITLLESSELAKTRQKKTKIKGGGEEVHVGSYIDTSWQSY
jgi:hypothetical protein